MPFNNKGNGTEWYCNYCILLSYFFEFNCKFTLKIQLNTYLIMWSCPGNMPKYYPGLRSILPDWRGGLVQVICQNITQVWETYYPTEGEVLHVQVICQNITQVWETYYPTEDAKILISLLYWVSNCPGNMPKYYSTYQISLQKLTRSIIMYNIKQVLRWIYRYM
jgi:hypothetical protein